MYFPLKSFALYFAKRNFSGWSASIAPSRLSREHSLRHHPLRPDQLRFQPQRFQISDDGFTRHPTGGAQVIMARVIRDDGILIFPGDIACRDHTWIVFREKIEHGVSELDKPLITDNQLRIASEHKFVRLSDTPDLRTVNDHLKGRLRNIGHGLELLHVLSIFMRCRILQHWNFRQVMFFSNGLSSIERVRGSVHRSRTQFIELHILNFFLRRMAAWIRPSNRVVAKRSVGIYATSSEGT